MSIGVATNRVGINAIGSLVPERARQFALDILDACDEAERLHQQQDPEGYAQGLRNLIQEALNEDDDYYADGKTVVRSYN